MEENLYSSTYQILVFIHLLLFVLWLGADVGVFLLGQHFRKREKYDLSQRMVLLQLLVNLDMVPRSAWALMVPITISMLAVGDYWALTTWWLLLAWIIGGFLVMARLGMRIFMIKQHVRRGIEKLNLFLKYYSPYFI